MSPSRVRVFAPPLDSTWRLTQDMTLPNSTLRIYGNDEFMWNLRGQPKLGVTESLRYTFQTPPDPNYPDVLPKGTVIVFDRYHVSHSGEDQITVRVLASPNPLITPKKSGGKGKGKMRLYLTLDDLNNLGELEHAQP